MHPGVGAARRKKPTRFPSGPGRSSAPPRHAAVVTAKPSRLGSHALRRGCAAISSRNRRRPSADANVTATISELIVTRRFGLAAILAKQAGMAEPRPTVLRLSALADAVRGETGPCASTAAARATALDADLLAAEVAVLRLAVPALIRVALVTGESAAGALLTTLSARVERNLATIAEQVGRRALQGVLIGNPLRTVLADVGELTAQVEQAREAARERLRPRTLRFKRATDMPRSGWPPTGSSASLLTAAADDDRSRRAEVTPGAALSGHGVIDKEIDRLDAKHKGNSGNQSKAPGAKI